MVRLLVGALALALAPVTGVAATPPCSPGSGACNEANGTPGCKDIACCEAVCAIFTSCCDIEWDADCVAFTALFPDVCEGTFNPACGPGTGPCYAPNGTPGCEDLECCDQICLIDPFCCSEFWDFSCASVAAQFCPLWPCTIECPSDAKDEHEPCGVLANEGCNMGKPAFGELPLDVVVCGRVWAEAQFRDTDWFLLTVPPTSGSPRTQVAVTLVSEPAVALLLIDPRNCPLRTPVVIDAVFGGGCVPTVLNAALTPGTYAVVITTALKTGPIFDGFPCGTLNAYTLFAMVAGSRPDCVGDLDDSGKVDGADLGALLQQWETAGSADLDGDGIVDGADLGLLLNAWGPCAEPG